MSCKARDARVFFYYTHNFDLRIEEGDLEFKPLDEMPYYAQASKLTEAMNLHLIYIQVSSSGRSPRVNAVVAKKGNAPLNAEELAEVHRALLLRLEALLKNDDVYMELSSPGLERKIKNAAEFSFYIGREVSLYDKTAGEWKKGRVIRSDSQAVVLSFLDDSGEEKEETYKFSDIAKAKLA